MTMIACLAERLDISEGQCREFFEGASRKYKSLLITKRMGGYRRIAQPSKELKRYQRAFLDLYHFPVHDNAMGYVKGRSIKHNASMHASNPYLFKTDIANFFNSIKPQLFWWVLEQLAKKETKSKQAADLKIERLFEALVTEKRFVNELLFWRPGKRSEKLILSIGAPSSPTISNFCMFIFDEHISALCRDFGITYTRYVDDLTFSTKTPNILPGFIHKLREELKICLLGTMDLNLDKTHLSSKAHNRRITGITLTNNENLSIGRKQKRYIKHLVHLFIKGDITEDDLSYLRGYLSYAHYIEPEFVVSLFAKYTCNVMNRIVYRQDF